MQDILKQDLFLRVVFFWLLFSSVFLLIVYGIRFETFATLPTWEYLSVYPSECNSKFKCVRVELQKSECKGFIEDELNFPIVFNASPSEVGQSINTCVMKLTEFTDISLQQYTP